MAHIDDTTEDLPVVDLDKPPANVEGAARALHRRRQAFADEPGIPKSVERRRASPLVGSDFISDSARQAWALDLLAWGRYGQLAPRVDQRGPRAAMPPVVLPEAPDGELVCLDLARTIGRLRSRHRAFSQVAGRYSPMVLAARESGRRLRIEVWDLDGDVVRTGDFTEAETLPDFAIADAIDNAEGGGRRKPDDNMEAMLQRVATYIDADISLESLTEARAIISGLLDKPLPEEILARNPLAWVVHLAGASSTSI